MNMSNVLLSFAGFEIPYARGAHQFVASLDSSLVSVGFVRVLLAFEAF
jgi:hypothetical protein